MTKRHPVAVVALTLVTFTLYAYWWLHRTTDELRRETDRDDLSPAVDVILTLVSFGLWGIWAGYRNAKIAHEELVDRGVDHTDRSLAVGGFAALSLVSGWAWLVSMALLQEDFNRLAEPVDHFLPAQEYGDEEAASPRRARSKVRVDANEPAPAAAPVSAWESAPSAPVFESSAPMPIVY